MRTSSGPAGPMGPQGPPGEPSDPFNRRVCGGATKRTDDQTAIAAIVAAEEPAEPEARHVLSKRGVEPYIGEIALYPYSFCPRGWLPCDGQLLQIASNTALCKPPSAIQNRSAAETMVVHSRSHWRRLWWRWTLDIRGAGHASFYAKPWR